MKLLFPDFAALGAFKKKKKNLLQWVLHTDAKTWVMEAENGNDVRAGEGFTLLYDVTYTTLVKQRSWSKNTVEPAWP